MVRIETCSVRLVESVLLLAAEEAEQQRVALATKESATAGINRESVVELDFRSELVTPLREAEE